MGGGLDKAGSRDLGDLSARVEAGSESVQLRGVLPTGDTVRDLLGGEPSLAVHC